MKRTVTIVSILLVFIFTGCNEKASQEIVPTIAPLEYGTSPARLEVEEPEEQPESKDDQITASRSNAITRAVEKASPAIVSITVTEVERGYNRVMDPFFSRFYQIPAEREVKSIGSGFIISEEGLIVTNEHVASKSALKIMVALSNGDDYEAELLGSDELADLALLKIKEPKGKLPTVKFSDSETAMVGEWAIAMGNPFGLFDDGQASVTVGVISATKRDFRPDPKDPRVYIDMIQTDAAINRGNSGGPLVNSSGEVIGVNTFIFTGGTSNGFVGLGFAIPANRVKKIIKQLEESGEVALDFDPGLEFTRMTTQIVYQYGVPSIHGLFVTSVNKNGPAYESGVMPGDIITKIGGERVSSEMHAWALMREFEEGEKMSITLVRGQNQYEAVMTLRRRVKGQ